MLELLKIIGSAAITAAATLIGLWLKRKWELRDRTDEQKRSVDDRLDDVVERLSKLEKAVDGLSTDVLKEIAETDLKNRCLQAGLREMLYDRIKFLAHKYINDGKIREEEYKSLERMWEVYHRDLGGNGYLDGEMSKVKVLEKV